MNFQKLKLLHLGAGTGADLSVASLTYFAKHDVIHFGEAPDGAKVNLIKRFSDALIEYGVLFVVSQIAVRIRHRVKFSNKLGFHGYKRISQPIRNWYYKKGEKLPFPDNTFDAVYSEHFFEHLFIDEACALFGEIKRVLSPGGIVRTSVPDADLRTYLAPEPIGFPSKRMRFTHPSKHKTRWNVYSLGLVLERVGLIVQPITFCDKEGQFHNNLYTPTYPLQTRVSDRVQEHFIGNPIYVMRQKSLIVDGIKEN